jgi:hypothetical protein
MCKECDDPEMNSKVCSGYPSIKFRCEACGQELKQVPPDPVDPKLQSLKDTLERSEREAHRLHAEFEAAENARWESLNYRDKCCMDLEEYKKSLKRRNNATLAADFLEREAKKLREHPETFEDVKWTQDYPVSARQRCNASGVVFERHDPCTTTIKLVTWPQRKVAKEGESK